MPNIFELVVTEYSLVQCTLMMLDLPLDVDPVTDTDLANFSVKAFGTEALLKTYHEPVRPVYYPDSLFLRNFSRIVQPGQEEVNNQYKQLGLTLLHKKAKQQ